MAAPSSREIVLSADRQARFWSFVDRRGADECWPWLAKTIAKGARARGAFYVNGFLEGAPRIALVLGKGEQIPAGMQACHKCDNPICVNPAHLYAGTPRDNSRDMVRRGRYMVGDTNPLRRFPEKSPTRKLTREDVQRIRSLRGTAIPRVIAEQFGVSRNTVGRILSGETWAWLPERPC